MAKHKRWATTNWEFLFRTGYRPPDYAFEVRDLRNVKDKHIVLYQELLANARREWFIEEEDAVPVSESPSIG